LISLIRPENFEQEVVAEKRPVLVLCMTRDEEFPQQMKALEDIARRYGDEIKAGVLEEDFIQAFKKKYNILGSPTFLILVEGQEKSAHVGACRPRNAYGFNYEILSITIVFLWSLML